MSDIDDAIRREVHRRLDSLEVPITGRTSDLRTAHRRSRQKRRIAVAAGTGVVVLGAVASLLVLGGGKTSPPSIEPANPIRVVRTFSASSLGLVHPEAAAMGPNGHLYITDSAHQTVTEVAGGGRVVRSWGGPGTGPGEFRLANGGIAVDQQGRVYVADSGNARVQVFTKSGQFIRQMGAFGDESGQFEFPWAIAVGADGAVYLSDDRQTTLTKLSVTGHQQWRLGDGEPGTPRDLVGHTHFGSLDSRGRLVVADDDSGRVVYLSARGQEVDAFGTGDSGDHENSLGHPVAADFPEGACDTTVDAHDFVYVGGCVVTPTRGMLVQMYDPAHRLVGSWPRSPLLTAPRFGPNGLAVAVGFDSILELSVDR